MPDLLLKEQEVGEDFQLIATIKPEEIKREQDLALQQNIQTLRNRVNELGVAEPIVQQQGADRIVVQLAGVQDPGRAKEILGRTATLEIRLVSEEHAAGPGYEAFLAYKTQPAPFGTEKLLDLDGRAVLVKKAIVITGDRIKDSQPGFDQRDGPPDRLRRSRRHGRANDARDDAREREEAHGDDHDREGRGGRAHVALDQ